MVDPKVVQEWLQKADEDFGFAEYALKDTTFYAPICFHFQQSAEKYIKAFIIARELPFKKTHTLIALLKICKEEGYDLDLLTDAVNFLDGCYVDTRYPVHWPSDYSREKAVAAREAADKVRAVIKDSLQFNT